MTLENYTCSSQDFQDTKHIVNRAVRGKNRGIYPRVNLYKRLLEVFGVPDGGIYTHESGNTAANYSNSSFNKRGAGYDVLLGSRFR